jgi:hypothetical protein
MTSASPLYQQTNERDWHITAATFLDWLRTSSPGETITYAKPVTSLLFEQWQAEQRGMNTRDLQGLMSVTQRAGNAGYVHFTQRRLATGETFAEYEYRASRSKMEIPRSYFNPLP